MPVISMKESPFLVPVHRIVGRVQVEHDLGRRRGVRLQKNLHQQTVHRLRVEGNLLVALVVAHHRRGQLHPVEGSGLL